MAQIIHNISFPNDGNGDELRTAFGNQNLNNTDLYTNKVDKEVGKGLSTNDYTNAEKTKLAGIEEGAQVNVQADWSQNDDTADDFIKNKPEQLASSVGHFHVANDLPSQSIIANTPTVLLNDGEGDFSTNDFAPNGITNIWDSTTNSFDFSEFSLGDQLAVRVDLRVDTTSANQKIECYIVLGEGTENEYTLYIGREQIKNTTSDLPFQKSILFSIDNEDWAERPAKVLFKSDDDAVVTVIGWYIPILRKSVNILEVEGGGDGVQSVTGSMVNNTDPLNPVINSDSTKLDKSVTPLAVYATDAGGNQEMKLISEIGGGEDTFSLFFTGNNLNFSTLNNWYSGSRPFSISTATSCGTGAVPNSSLNTSAAHPIPQGYKIDSIIFGIFSKSNNIVASDLEFFVQVGECDFETTTNALSTYQTIANEVVSTGTTASTPKFYKKLTVADYDINILDVQSFQFAYRETANTNTISISFLVTFKKA
jgi:hypothetical protein